MNGSVRLKRLRGRQAGGAPEGARPSRFRLADRARVVGSGGESALRPEMREAIPMLEFDDRVNAHLGHGQQNWACVRLDRRGVVIRRVGLAVGDDTVRAAAEHLSATERERAARGTPDVHRRRTVMRSALRTLLGELLDMDPGVVPLASRPGRPQLAPAAGLEQIDLSCSASGDVGLVAVASGVRIGIDVQRVLVEEARAAWAEGWLAPAERTRIAGLPADAHTLALTRAWVQKEAFLKGQGVGLFADLASVVTPVRDSGRVGAWRLTALHMPDGYVASLAVGPMTSRRRVRRALTSIEHLSHGVAS